MAFTFFTKSNPAPPRRDAGLPLDLQIGANVLMPDSFLAISVYPELNTAAAKATKVLSVASIECADGHKLYRGYLDHVRDIFIEVSVNAETQRPECVLYSLWCLEHPLSPEEWQEFIEMEHTVWTDEAGQTFSLLGLFDLTERGLLDPMGVNGWESSVRSRIFINDSNPEDIMRLDVHHQGDKPCVKWLRGIPLPSDFEFYPAKEV